LVLLTITILAIEMRTRGRSSYYGGDVGSASAAVRLRLGRWRWPSFFFCAVLVTLALVLPAGVLLYWLVRGLKVGVAFPSLWAAALNSLLTSGAAAGLALVAAVPVAVLSVRRAGSVSGILERISYSAFALPGMVVALALVFFGANFARPLYQTMVLLLLGYLILFLPQVVGALRAALLQLSPSLEHAARTLGRGPLAVFRTITLPITWPGLAAGAGLVFLTAMKELPVTLMLAPLGFRTLSTSVWSAVSEAYFAAAAAPALFLILLSSLPMALLVLREEEMIA
jgi:iron(III) transport system permease protein